MRSVRPQGHRSLQPGALAAAPATASPLVGVFGPTAPARAAEITDGLALRDELDATSGAVAVDSSGRGRNGAVNGTAGWSGAGEGLTFNGSDAYIQVPDNIMSGMNSITVSTDVQIDAAQATPYFLFNSFWTAIASGGFSNEQNGVVARNTSLTITRGSIGSGTTMAD
jgi:hypothetical protein